MSIDTSSGRSPSSSGAAQSVTIVGGSFPRSNEPGSSDEAFQSTLTAWACRNDPTASL
jgi:hypothetical protein